jgi:hypothetical protein
MNIVDRKIEYILKVLNQISIAREKASQRNLSAELMPFIIENMSGMVNKCITNESILI